MLDLHNHILYELDDGSRSIEESIEMAKMFVESGYSHLICTPHYRPEDGFVMHRTMELERLQTLQDKLDRENIFLKLHLGNELYYTAEVLELLEKGLLSPMASSHYVLLEFSFNNEPVGLANFVYQLQLLGYSPILAHVERYAYVQKDPSWIEQYLDLGCYIQCNLSYVDDEDSKDYEVISHLLEKGQVHLFATDAHQSKWRNPQVKEQLEALFKWLGPENYQTLLVDNPFRVLENKPLRSAKIFPKKKKKTWNPLNWLKKDKMRR